MEVKGTAVKSLVKYMKKIYPEKFNDWLDLLPEEVREEFKNIIFSSRWYDVDLYMRLPILKAAEVANADVKKMAWDMGVYSSKEALSGVYRVFTKFTSISLMIKKVFLFLSTYYRPSSVEVTLLDEAKRHAVIIFRNFISADDIIMQRIAGWGYSTLIQTGAKKVELSMEQFAENDVIMTVDWE